MSKSKKKYYTVWKGHRTGVFETWNECKLQITSFEGAQYKSFPTAESAKTALQGNYRDYIGKSKKLTTGLSEARLKLIVQTLKRRVQTLESACVQKDQHVVVVFFGTSEADANADRLIEEGRAEAERLDKELRVLRVGWIK